MDLSILTQSIAQSVAMRLSNKIKKEWKTMNNVLVTGGSGFIGGHLVQALHDTYPNINITVVDDLRTPGNYIVDSNRVSYYYKSNCYWCNSL
ncbi:MAG: NAD(P)-dependent oxidoreductase [Proteobacteria bacterium]|nr:NAD(P)-dependent oxidoreductase [Pseudomonadota bacterium]